MHNMMQSVARYLVDNAGRLGIPADAVQFIVNPDDPGDIDTYRQSLTLNHLRTEGDPESTAFNNSSADWAGEVDNFQTIFEILVTCRPQQADRGKAYYPNEARTLAGKVQTLFRGSGTGLVINRTAWDKPGTPVEGDGLVDWPPRMDSQPQADGDPAHVIVLTFEMTWWAPAPTA